MRTLLTRVLPAAVGGVATALAFPPSGWALLLPLGVALLTVVTVSTRPRTGFLLGAVYGTAFMLTLLPWLGVIGVYAWVPLSVVEGLFYGLVGLSAAATARLRWWPVWLACAWVGVELLRSSLPFGGFPWGRLAFATVDTPVAPLFAWVGAPGVSFVVALLGTVLGWAVLEVRRSRLRVAAPAAVAAAGVLAAAAAPFPVNAASSAPGLPRLRVAAVQGNVPGTGLAAFAQRRAVLDNHVAATLGLAERIRAGQVARPDLVVWPENSSDIDPYADPAAHAEIATAAEAVHAPLLMGAVVGDRGVGWFNRAIVWTPRGTIARYYDKTHPVPFGEYIPLRGLLASRVPALAQIPSDMVAGSRPGVLRAGRATVGVLMCFEVAYDGLLRSVVRDGAQVIVVPTNNATYTGTGQVEQQFAISRLRAIETGRYVVVASTNGISGIIAPDGRVIREAPTVTRAVLEAGVALDRRLTPAMRLERWLEYLLTAAGLVAVAVGLAVSRRHGRARVVRNPNGAPVVHHEEPPVTSGRA